MTILKVIPRLITLTLEQIRLAEKIGGQAKQAFLSDPQLREFDVINDQYIGQAKTGNEQLSPKIRNQAKATFEAAQQSGREVYYEFENQPSQDVVDKLNEYSQRYRVNLTIDVRNP